MKATTIILALILGTEIFFSTKYFIESQSQIAQLKSDNALLMGKLSAYEAAMGK